MIPALLAIVLFSGTCHAKQIGLLILDSDTLIVSQAVHEADLPKGTTAVLFTREMLESDKKRSCFLDSDVLVVDVMDTRWVEYLEKKRRPQQEAYLRCERIEEQRGTPETGIYLR